VRPAQPSPNPISMKINIKIVADLDIDVVADMASYMADDVVADMLIIRKVVMTWLPHGY
jgi:hypothetical protein